MEIFVDCPVSVSISVNVDVTVSATVSVRSGVRLTNVNVSVGKGGNKYVGVSLGKGVGLGTEVSFVGGVLLGVEASLAFVLSRLNQAVNRHVLTKTRNNKWIAEFRYPPSR